MQTDTLILVKHAMPLIVPDTPARTWLLSDGGRRAAARLALDLAPRQPVAVVTSREPKAAETGQIIANQLNLPVANAPGLHEHERDSVPFENNERFHERMRQFFTDPSIVVYGAESADAAHARFEAAIRAVGASNAAGPLVVVAHGTVISLLVARANGIEPYPYWQRLGLPSFVVVDRETFALAAAT